MAKRKPSPFAKPLSFRDVPIERVLEVADKLSDLKNLGPESEKALQRAGVKTVKQFIKLGWEEVMVRLVKENPKNRHSMFAYAIIGATQNVYWNKISEEDKLAARNLMAAMKSKSKK